MSWSIASRWPVRVSASVGAGDVEADGRLTTEAVDRLFGAARAEYFRRCTTVDTSALAARLTSIRQTGVCGVRDEVSVVASVVEIYPDSFTMSCRVTGEGEEAICVDATCSVAVAGGVHDEMRDEFIAMAHAAQHLA